LRWPTKSQRTSGANDPAGHHVRATSARALVRSRARASDPVRDKDPIRAVAAPRDVSRIQDRARTQDSGPTATGAPTRAKDQTPNDGLIQVGAATQVRDPIQGAADTQAKVQIQVAADTPARDQTQVNVGTRVKGPIQGAVAMRVRDPIQVSADTRARDPIRAAAGTRVKVQTRVAVAMRVRDPIQVGADTPARDQTQVSAGTRVRGRIQTGVDTQARDRTRIGAKAQDSGSGRGVRRGPGPGPGRVSAQAVTTAQDPAHVGGLLGAGMTASAVDLVPGPATHHGGRGIRETDPSPMGAAHVVMIALEQVVRGVVLTAAPAGIAQPGQAGPRIAITRATASVTRNAGAAVRGAGSARGEMTDRGGTPVPRAGGPVTVPMHVLTGHVGVRTMIVPVDRATGPSRRTGRARRGARPLADVLMGRVHATVRVRRAARVHSVALDRRARPGVPLALERRGVPLVRPAAPVTGTGAPGTRRGRLGGGMMAGARPAVTRTHLGSRCQSFPAALTSGWSPMRCAPPCKDCVTRPPRR
jgi:hypothetical protein